MIKGVFAWFGVGVLAWIGWTWVRVQLDRRKHREYNPY